MTARDGAAAIIGARGAARMIRLLSPAVRERVPGLAATLLDWAVVLALLIELARLVWLLASPVARVLNALQPAAGLGAVPAARARLIADPRTNSLLMSGDAASRLRLRAVASHLDTPLESDGNTHVIYLQYANAKDLAPILEGVVETVIAEVASDTVQELGIQWPARRRHLHRQPVPAGLSCARFPRSISSRRSTRSTTTRSSPMPRRASSWSM